MHENEPMPKLKIYFSVSRILSDYSSL